MKIHSPFFLSVFMLAGCSAADSVLGTPPPPVIAEPTLASQPIATRALPTLAPTLASTRAAPTVAGATTRVKIFLIALNDNGKSGKKIGCNDSAIAVERVVPQTSAPLRAALEELLALRQREYGQSGLYHALYQSDLKVDSVAITDAKATIHLNGKLFMGGVCDHPRVEAQIEQTALQFSTVKDVEIFVNQTPLKTILSGK